MTALTARQYAEDILRRVLDRRVALDRVLERIVDEVRTQVGADRGTLYLVDHATGELVSKVAHLPEISAIRLRLGEGVAGRVAATGVVVRHPPGPTSREVDALTGYVTRNLIAAPVSSGGAIVAVLQLLNKHGGFSDQDAELVSALCEQVADLLDQTSLSAQLRPGHRQPLAFRFNHIVGDSAAMQAVYDTTTKAARSSVTVLVRGESGSGKELIARAIHDNSERVEGPFVKVDCAALPENLVENELFGHVRGAYTGAISDAVGKVDAAQGGTLFLDEIGELGLTVQSRLLRLLQDKSFLRVGGTASVEADVRFVCATHVDLERAVAEKRFRQDLYYRLRVVEIRTPSLRERGGGDLDRLIDHFLHRFCREHGRSLELSDAARAALHAHDWPGNVRELQHCLEAAVVLAGGETIERTGLRLGPHRAGVPGRFTSAVVPLRELEKHYVEHVLELCQGNKSEAARLLGIGRNTLSRKLSEP